MAKDAFDSVEDALRWKPEPQFRGQKYAILWAYQDTDPVKAQKLLVGYLKNRRQPGAEAVPTQIDINVKDALVPNEVGAEYGLPAKERAAFSEEIRGEAESV